MCGFASIKMLLANALAAAYYKVYMKRKQVIWRED
jgi:hypothetical protein